MMTRSVPVFSLWRKPTPPPGSRIKPEGVDNYLKNRGTLKGSSLEQHEAASSPPTLAFTPRDIARCPTSASRVNYTSNVIGTVGRLLNGSATPRPATAPGARVKPEAEGIAVLSKGVRIRPLIHQLSSPTQGSTPRPQPRVKVQAEVIAEVSKGKRMRSIIHEFGQHGPSPRCPRVKTEGQNTAHVAKGGRMHNLMHKYGQLPLSARAVPRVKPEGEDNALLDMGRRMNNIIHKFGCNDVTPRAPPRVKKEGADNAELDRGNRMATLVRSYTLPASARHAPRVKPQAAESATLAMGGRMNKLMHASHALPVSPHPQPRVSGSSARRNLTRGVLGTVGRCLKRSGRQSWIYVPGEQWKRYSIASTV